MKHTILGAEGAIVKELISVLQSNNIDIRLVSRRAQHVEGTESMDADILKFAQLLSAIKGSDVVYLVVELAYKAKVWEKKWPLIMHNVIRACKIERARLVFLDNIYMYGHAEGIITEDAPYRYSGRKGRVRANVANMLLKQMEAGRIIASIGRTVDMYGPGMGNQSTVGRMVFDRMKRHKKALWAINADVPHSLAYSRDVAEALYILATRDKAIGQVWHLPAASPLTGRQFVGMAAEYMHRPNRLIVLPKWLLGIAGNFIPSLAEAHEVNYQDEFPLLFSSARFEKAFNYLPTAYEDGIMETAAWHLTQDCHLMDEAA